MLKRSIVSSTITMNSSSQILSTSFCGTGGSPTTKDGVETVAVHSELPDIKLVGGWLPLVWLCLSASGPCLADVVTTGMWLMASGSAIVGKAAIYMYKSNYNRVKSSGRLRREWGFAKFWWEYIYIYIYVFPVWTSIRPQSKKKLELCFNFFFFWVVIAIRILFINYFFLSNNYILNIIITTIQYICTLLTQEKAICVH